jgi:hypothetical protein
MRTVADEAGDRYLLLKQSSDSWLVRDPATGDEYHRPAADLRVVDGESPLETAAASAPEAVHDALPRLDDRAIGLLVEIKEREPIGVRALLDAYDLCESDLHGLLAEFQAAGLVAETRVGGERGYETTADAGALFAEG